ncbi:oligosaccharide flippase family protein [Chondromyces apiculatus]|uniref:Polysaccharide biosynthesis protein n=1 Tax=Chondromyces apiculatus DSM 436 TaxID=1192034 RepID=A0A017T1H2_9BACT|nr:oligosaccharide flippase family protein [Chondromyces apiculatus]EYF03043.1 polysaccharide biosynthesis protein [Chondromyces apiculatus DSM 436]
MAKQSALARRTVIGAMWTIATGLGARAMGLAGTMLLTHYVAPDIQGEVNGAQVAAYTAYFASGLGLGQYIVAHPDIDRQSIFNATVYYLTACLLAVSAVFLLREPIARAIETPGMVTYMSGCVVAVVLERLSYIPDRIMIRDMRFKEVGVRNTIGELTYTVSSVGLAMRGWGGNAIVAGMLLRALVRVVITVPAVDHREWLTPSPLSREKARRMLSFGIPLSLGSLANFGSQRWDNLVMLRLFGERVGGLYNLAWNLADIPASQVGERIGDVLVPSFAKLEPERRKGALIRAVTMMSLLIFPLAVGLGAVAPTVLRDTVFPPSWYDAGPLLSVLAALGVTRPLGWVIASYLQVHGRTRSIMVLEWLKVAAIILGVGALGVVGGPLWACAGVGLAFGLHALASMALVRRVSDIRYVELLRPLVRPLLACVPLVLAVLGTRAWLSGFGDLPRGVRVFAEVVAGASAFVLAVLVVAPAASREFLGTLRGALRRGR